MKEKCHQFRKDMPELSSREIIDIASYHWFLLEKKTKMKYAKKTQKLLKFERGVLFNATAKLKSNFHSKYNKNKWKSTSTRIQKRVHILKGVEIIGNRGQSEWTLPESIPQNLSLMSTWRRSHFPFVAYAFDWCIRLIALPRLFWNKLGTIWSKKEAVLTFSLSKMQDTTPRKFYTKDNIVCVDILAPSCFVIYILMV